MEKVRSTDLSTTKNILHQDSPSFSGIIAGICKGEIWVDRLVDPRLALVYSYAVGSFSIMGSPEDASVYNDFYKFLRDELFMELKSKGIKDFEFSVESENAKDHVLEIFSHENILQEEEYSYRKNDGCKLQAVDGYTIAPVDWKLIKQFREGSLENPEFLNERLLESWETYEIFVDRSIGYVALDEKSIVGVIIGTARYHNVIPIDIEIDKGHRKKGLALTLTNHFVKGCVESGLVPQWDCVESNIGSRKTAEKAGFKLFKREPVYWFGI